MSGGSARVWERALVHEYDVAPAEAAEVIGDAVADDAAADDYASRLSWETCHRYSGW
jgi:hypothetical protein